MAQDASTSTVELAAVGDILLARGVESKIEKFGAVYPFAKVKHILSGADIAFGNLENPITEKCGKLDKKYSFQAKPIYTNVLSNAGFDILSLANNHSFDCGQIGLFETFENLKKEKLLWIGAGKSKTEDNSSVYIEVKGIKFAFLGFTAISPSKELAEISHISIATAENVKNSVSAAKQKADVVIVSIHWGTEYDLRPNTEQKTLADIAIKAGADAILGHHPHVLQDIDLIDRPNATEQAIIAFSLGNFVFDSPVRLNKRLAESVILKMRFSKNGLIDHEIIPVVIENYRPVIADEKNKNLILSRFDLTSDDAEEYFKKQIEVDLDSDGKTESISINGEEEKSLQVKRDGKLLWEDIPASWKPWKMEIADVDGDGKKEMIVGVFKSTKFFPKPHNCLFIYGWSGEKGFPKWLGSSLGRVFTDYLFADLDGKTGDELIALETTLEGKKSLAIYKWNGFGFTMIQKNGVWATAKILGAKDGEISVQADGKEIIIKQK